MELEENHHLSMEELESEIVDDEGFGFKIDEDEDEELELVETTSPRVLCWLGVDGKTHHGVTVVTDYDLKNNSNKCRFDDACAICFEALSSHGKHQICCLPCGHIYGLSCIKKWLLQCSSSGGGKCPQCNKLSTHKDVILLYAGAHLKAPSSTRYYPFTKQGFIDFKMHEDVRRAHAKKNFIIDKKRLRDVLNIQFDMKDRWLALKSQWDDLVEKMEEQPAGALDQQIQALRQQLDALSDRLIALDRRTGVLDQRVDVFMLRYNNEYWERLDFFKEMYKEHLIQQQQKKKKGINP